MDQVVVFQKMFEQVRKEQNFSWFYWRCCSNQGTIPQFGDLIS